MFKKILENSIHIISNDTKFIRFSFITSFFHSVSAIVMILYSLNNILNAKFNKGISYSNIFSYLQDKTSLVIIIAIIAFIGYQLIYPIGQATIINYLDKPKRNLGKAIGKGVEKFFPMFEFNNLLWLFGMITFITTVLRLVYLEILNNFFILILLSIWGLCVLTVSFIRPYTKYAISIEGLGLYDAIKRSSTLSLHNFGLTIKFVILEYFLLLRFFFSTLTIIGVPLLIVYITTNLNALDSAFTENLIIGTTILLLFITTYVNGIIEAFFATYRYKVYNHIVRDEINEEIEYQESKYSSLTKISKKTASKEVFVPTTSKIQKNTPSTTKTNPMENSR